MKSVLKRIQLFVFIMLLIALGALFIYLGYSYYKITRKQYPFGVVIDTIWLKYVEIAKVDEKYYLGDDFNIEGDVSVKLNSEEVNTKSLTDIQFLKKRNLYWNLSNMDIHYIFNHDLDNRRAYLELDEKIGEESILNGKYLIDNSTGYYYVNGILDNYVNCGNNTYFEMLNEKNTTKANRNYLYNFIRQSLKRNILEKDLLAFNTETNINNESVKVGQVSLKLTNKMIRKILNGIIDDLKKDERANLIMSSIYPNFSKYKISDKTNYLKKNENYTINIYTSKFLCNPLKVEVVHLIKDRQEIYTYEGGIDSGLFYYSLNNDMKYNATYKGNERNNEIIVYNSSSKEIGSIKIDKDVNNVMFLMNLELDDKKYDINYSFKHKNYKENKSFEKERVFDIKIVDGNIEKINGSISINSLVKKKSKVEIDVSEAVLESTLEKKDKDLYDNLEDNIKSRLEIIK